MASSNLEKFKKRQALVAYFRHVFGVEDVNDPESVREYYRSLRSQGEGRDNEDRSHVYNAIKGRVRGIDPKDLLRYDENVRRHTEKLNRHRSDEITLKYFQILPALMTEHYLDRLDKDPETFASDINEFLEEQDERRGGRIDYPRFEPSDLNKLAYWMATGSGKTLLMHINYYQYLDHFPDSFDNIILVTPNEGLSHQHIKEMKKSGITGYRFNAATTDLYRHDPEFVKVIEITKLTEDKEGEGQSIEVSSFEGRNLVFADEGHKGAGGEAWMENRKRLADEGFTFEYSATFGQGIAGSGVNLEEEYGQSIIFDYSYPRFYEDGYGKDYRILNLDNLEDGIGDELRDRYMLANLLSFYEQVRCYQGNEDVFYSTYNVRRPLLVFVGHTVQASTRSKLGKSDKKTLSDVQDIVRFLSKVLRNDDGWVPEAIDDILAGESGITDAEGRDLFSSFLRILREEQPEGKAVYADMLRDLFHAESRGTLHLVDIEDAQGEIGLRAGTSDEFFGVINIGNDRGFLDDAEEKLPDVQLGSQKFRGSLFELIQERDSPIQTLIGAKKFIEGWDSWRVSTMGLMNIGRGEGPQIIQLFGRGVRLEGKDKTLKRSEELPGDHPEELPTLETLNIFGIRADYMAQFRDYLAEEGIDTERREPVEIATKMINEDFEGKGLLVVRPEEGLSFVDETSLELEVAPEYGPEIDLAPQGDVIVSHQGAGLGGAETSTESITIPDAVLPLLDWHQIYREMWNFRQSRGYDNLILRRETLRRIIEEHHYDLQGREDLLEIEEYADLSTVRRVVSMILSKYVDNFYSARKREFEMERLTYRSLEEDLEGKSNNIPEKITARVKVSAEDFLETLEEKRDDPELYGGDDGLPERVHFDRHLYAPLLIAEDSDDPSVKYSPPGLTPSEASFVTDLKVFFEEGNGDELVDDWEVFLLRNRSRGHGVGFLAGDYDEKFFPDFILWLVGDDQQHVAFIDPKGLKMAGDVAETPKVRFSEEIKKYQEELEARTGRDDVSLHSRIVSWTDFQELEKNSRFDSREEFQERGVYFHDDPVGKIINNMLSGESP